MASNSLSNYLKKAYQNVPKFLLQLAQDLGKEGTLKAKKNARWSSLIPPAISFKVEQRGDNAVVIYSVDLKKAPMGAAFEFGSGLHATQQAPATYPIKPSNKKALAFVWDKANPNIPTLPDGRVVLPIVQHPGVVARPYLIPAIEDVIADVEKLFVDDIKILFP